MLTGDLKQVGEEIGRRLKIDQVYTQLLPADKVERLEILDAAKRKGSKIVFVGGGINDAPVLARADIGIAIGGLGSDAAIEAADVVIMTDEPSKIATAIQVARRTRRFVYQNIAFALGVTGVFLVLGAMVIASMWEAVFADVGVAVIAILNAMCVMNTDRLTSCIDGPHLHPRLFSVSPQLSCPSPRSAMGTGQEKMVMSGIIV